MNASFTRTLAALAGAASLAGLTACAFLAPGTIPLGTSLDEVRHAGARPTGEYPISGGGRRLEFAMGQYGKQTYMLDFDAAGKLVASQQVLTDANLATIKEGMSVEDLRFRFGRPANIDYIGRQHLKVWDYRFADGDCVWYRVSVSDDGPVLSSSKSWDPVCDGPNGRD